MDGQYLEHESVHKARKAIRDAHAQPEDVAVRALMNALNVSNSVRHQYVQDAAELVTESRKRRRERSLLDYFLQQFGLSNQEGVALMCLAEALLRVPDVDTADALIAEKICTGNWSEHAGQSDSLFVNAATWALMLTGKIVTLDQSITGAPKNWIRGLVSKLGEPVVRQAVRQAMKIMGQEFVLGRDINEALTRARKNGSDLCSFDMLGEGARTHWDAARYLIAYKQAIQIVGNSSQIRDPKQCHGISVKISALHPRYETMQRALSFQQISNSLKELALLAKQAGMHMTIDAEEAARLEFSLDLISQLASDPDLAGWEGLGFAIQCYSKRALSVVNWIIKLSATTGRQFMVRFVKGAYWDTEIKVAQEKGLEHFPVFTRKASTDLSYLACAQLALKYPDCIYPQFATHNATTIAAIMVLAGTNRDFEFQRLHGMGELLYRTAQDHYSAFPQVRVYAPVGNHKDLLAYLVRRLLENGANSSFVNRFLDIGVDVGEVVADPFDQVKAFSAIAHPEIPTGSQMFGDARANSAGLDLDDPATLENILRRTSMLENTTWVAGPLVNGVLKSCAELPVTNPANTNDIVGHVTHADQQDALSAISLATEAQKDWDAQGGAARADILERAADLIEKDTCMFMALLLREAGKTYRDSEAEIREAVDFCRYYAAQARKEFQDPVRLPGPTGEANLYSLHGRGVFVCISPWNFPLAIFIGQVAAALAAGNSVVAKPAEQAPLVAFEAVKILHQSGVPGSVLHYLPGEGSKVGAMLTADPRIAGVTMTGSTDTAKIIAGTLARKTGPLVPFIAETGGQNAMFVDSTALPEQVVDDVIRSAFHSAGQRCSALRILYLQDDIADRMIELVQGAMDALNIGDPEAVSVDVGPVIDKEAQETLEAHIDEMTAAGKLLHRCSLDDRHARGHFVAPHLFEIERPQDLERENFGPILHVIRYRADQLEDRLQELAETQFGLTVGVHSRLQKTADVVFDNSLAGNVYVNRNMIGAVVGVQPFGGRGLSGTGPKAGGPLYMHRFATERVRTVNTAATGGNAELLKLA